MSSPHSDHRRVASQATTIGGATTLGAAGALGGQALRHRALGRTATAQAAQFQRQQQQAKLNAQAAGGFRPSGRRARFKLGETRQWGHGSHPVKAIEHLETRSKLIQARDVARAGAIKHPVLARRYGRAVIPVAAVGGGLLGAGALLRERHQKSLSKGAEMDTLDAFGVSRPDLYDISKDLTTAQRARLSPHQFGLPHKARSREARKESGNYPMPDLAHAKAALSRAAQHATPAEQAQISRRAHQKFPQLGKSWTLDTTPAASFRTPPSGANPKRHKLDQVHGNRRGRRHGIQPATGLFGKGTSRVPSGLNAGSSGRTSRTSSRVAWGRRPNRQRRKNSPGNVFEKIDIPSIKMPHIAKPVIHQPTLPGMEGISRTPMGTVKHVSRKIPKAGLVGAGVGGGVVGGAALLHRGNTQKNYSPFSKSVKPLVMPTPFEVSKAKRSAGGGGTGPFGQADSDNGGLFPPRSGLDRLHQASRMKSKGFRAHGTGPAPGFSTHTMWGSGHHKTASETRGRRSAGRSAPLFRGGKGS